MIDFLIEKEKTLERFDVAVNFFGLSTKKIAEILEYRNMNSYYNARSKLTLITYETIKKLSRAFPELNINWLVTGEGEMLLKDEPVAVSEPAVEYVTKTHLVAERMSDRLEEMYQILVEIREKVG